MTMKIDAEQRAMLARMETAHAETARHLAVIERQIEARAERMTTSSRVKARQYGRASATWSAATSATFRRTSRRCALSGAARSTRCPQAGAAGRSHRGHRVRYRINEPAGRACHDTALSRTEALIPDGLAGQADRERPHQRGT
jgi:hypothetical protein